MQFGFFSRHVLRQTRIRIPALSYILLARRHSFSSTRFVLKIARASNFRAIDEARNIKADIFFGTPYTYIHVISFHDVPVVARLESPVMVSP